MILEATLITSAVALAGWFGVRKARQPKRPRHVLDGSTLGAPEPESLHRLDVKISADIDESVAVVQPEAEEVEVEEPLTELPNLEGTLEFERLEEPLPKREVAVEVQKFELPATVASPVEVEEEEPTAPIPAQTTIRKVVVEEPNPPQGLFARFTGGGAPRTTDPVDLSDADDAFEAVDLEALASVEDLDPELGERLTALNAKLEGLGGIVSDLEETLSTFDGEEAVVEAVAETSDAEVEVLAA